MSLLQTIKAKQLAARKARDQIEISLLTTLIGEASMPGKNDGNRESTDAEVVAVIKKFRKNAEETLKALNLKGAIASDVETLSSANHVMQEIIILDTLLPTQLTKEQLTIVLQQFIAELPDKNAKSAFGAIMKKLKEEHEGLYDGSMASVLIKDLLK
jgi:uncharacterized protein YqeY